MGKPILCLDFDGVLHSYSSGWQGADKIPDPPVPGAIEFLDRAIDDFDVQIYSSRSHQPGGLEAMRVWLQTQVMRHFDCEFHQGSPREHERAITILNAIAWPDCKPSAFITIDDRALTFEGTWPSMDCLKRFKPWNKR